MSRAKSMEWHIVLNSDGLILAAYGSALLDMAEAKSREICQPLRTIRTISRPRVGDRIVLASL